MLFFFCQKYFIISEERWYECWFYLNKELRFSAIIMENDQDIHLVGGQSEVTKIFCHFEKLNIKKLIECKKHKKLSKQDEKFLLDSCENINFKQLATSRSLYTLYDVQFLIYTWFTALFFFFFMFFWMMEIKIG